MKHIYIILILFSSILLYSGCSDNDDNTDNFAIGSLSNLKATSGIEQIILSWDNPEYQGLSYIEIVYSALTSSESKTIKHETKGEKSSIVAIDVPEGREVYKFVLTAYSDSGDKSAPQEIKGKPYTNDAQAGMDAILDAMRIESVMNGVKFSWNNPNNISCMIEISYNDKGQNKKVSYDARQTIPTATIKLINSTIFKISITGTEGSAGINSSSTREETLAPNIPYKLSTDTWSVVDVSTQAATSGNGSAACAIDGTPATRWQATQKGGKDWIIIDMGSPVVIDRFSLTRYFGVADNSAWDVTFSAGNEPNPTVWPYEYSYANSKEGIFAIEFNRTRDGDQLYPIPEPITARYFKYRTDRISGSWATHYGEISVYGYYVE